MKSSIFGGTTAFALLLCAALGASAESWRATTTIGAPQFRDSHSAVWTGSRMIVWDGISVDYGAAGGFTVDYPSGGAAYDPATDTWTAISTANAPGQRNYHTAVWTGSRMIVWGGDQTSPTTGPAASTTRRQTPGPRRARTEHPDRARNTPQSG